MKCSRLWELEGMGEVYRARDPRLGREVAVKVLLESVAQDAERLRRFEKEARAVFPTRREGGEGEPSRHRVEIVHESLLKAWKIDVGPFPGWKNVPAW